MKFRPPSIKDPNQSDWSKALDRSIAKEREEYLREQMRQACEVSQRIADRNHGYERDFDGRLQPWPTFFKTLFAAALLSGIIWVLTR